MKKITLAIITSAVIATSVFAGIKNYRPATHPRTEPIAETQKFAAPVLNTVTASNAINSIDTDGSGTRASLEQMLDEIIGKAIDDGRLDVSKLTAQQKALIPEKFLHRNEYQLSAQEMADVERQLAQGDDAPPPSPPPFVCPDPNNLPETYDNAYNKMVLREHGCRVN